MQKVEGRDGWSTRERPADACTCNQRTKAWSRGGTHCIDAMHRPACYEGTNSNVIGVLEKKLTNMHGFVALATRASESSSCKS